MAKLTMGETIRILKQDTEKLTQQLIVSTAKREHAAIMGDEPRPTSFIRIVDGMVGAAEERVKPDGVIIYQYQRIAEVVQFAMETLFDLSPVLTGAYRNAHQMMLNGMVVANLANWRSGDEVTITNTLPYSRKIEVGKMKMKVSGSAEVYQQARRKIAARFGNVVSVQFTFRAVIDGAGVNQAKAASSGASWWLGHNGAERAASGVLETAIGKRHGKTAHNKADRRFPVIVITER